MPVRCDRECDVDRYPPNATETQPTVAATVMAKADCFTTSPPVNRRPSSRPIVIAVTRHGSTVPARNVATSSWVALKEATVSASARSSIPSLRTAASTVGNAASAGSANTAIAGASKPPAAIEHARPVEERGNHSDGEEGRERRAEECPNRPSCLRPNCREGRPREEGARFDEQCTEWRPCGGLTDEARVDERRPDEQRQVRHNETALVGGGKDRERRAELVRAGGPEGDRADGRRPGAGRAGACRDDCRDIAAKAHQHSCHIAPVQAKRPQQGVDRRPDAVGEAARLVDADQHRVDQHRGYRPHEQQRPHREQTVVTGQHGRERSRPARQSSRPGAS